MPRNAARVAELQVLLDPGEAEAIALAEELRADVFATIRPKMQLRNRPARQAVHESGGWSQIVASRPSRLVTGFQSLQVVRDHKSPYSAPQIC